MPSSSRRVPLQATLFNRAAFLAAATGWIAFALASGRAPVVIATRTDVPQARTEPPPPVEQCSEPPVSETYRELERLAQLAAARKWEHRVADLEQQLERERSAAASAAERAERSQARPAAAIAPAGPLLPAPAQPPSRRTSSRPRITAGAARVRLIGSDALVTGTLRNAGTRDATARLTVELLLDQRLLDRARLRVLVPAGGSTPWSRTFSTSLADGTYAARVRLDR